MKPEQLEQLISSLLRQHGAALRLFATTWSQTPDDCLQQALIKLATIEPKPDQPVAWLYRVVRNEAISRARSERRRRRREQRSAIRESLFQVAFDDDIDGETLASALGELPEDQREVVVARIWGGLTFEEIGQTAGCSSSAAHRRYRAGLEQMKQKLVNTGAAKDS